MALVAVRALRTLVLGDFALAVDGAALFEPRGLSAEILALLSLDAGHAIATTAIVDRIWPLAPPEQATARVHVHVSRVRRKLRELGFPAVLRSRSSGYALAVDASLRDHRQFEHGVEDGGVAAGRGDPQQATSLVLRSRCGEVQFSGSLVTAFGPARTWLG